MARTGRARLQPCRKRLQIMRALAPECALVGLIMELSRIKNAIRLVAGVLLITSGCLAQNIPSTIWGKWIVRRQLPTGTISCWGEEDAKQIIGTQIEYSDKIFRWKDVSTSNPIAEERTVTSDKFRDENSSPSSNGSQVSFHQLGIVAKQAKEISIHHEPANISGATIEIPGDSVLVKDPNTIIFSVCNLYFEAKRVHDNR
jgi:hypothetical protein